jgi:hypothetical protein
MNRARTRRDNLPGQKPASPGHAWRLRFRRVDVFGGATPAKPEQRGRRS